MAKHNRPPHHILDGKISGLQTWVIRVCARIDNELKKCRASYEALKSAGLEKEAKEHVQPRINDLIAERDKLILQAMKDRAKGAKWLVICYLAIDVAIEVGLDFGKVLNEITKGAMPVDNDFVKMMKERIKGVEEVLLTLDEQGDLPISEAYADFSEHAIEKIKETMTELVDEWTSYGKGKKYITGI